MEVDKKLGDLGEREVIRLVRGIIESGDLEFGDDVYSFKRRGEYIVFNIDGVAFEDFILPWMSFEDVGWKAVVMASSDIVAKAAKPYCFMWSIGLPRSFKVKNLLSIVEGGVSAAKSLNAKLVGGDLNECRGLGWIDVSSIGFSKVKPIPRFGGKPGTLILTTGEYGLTGAAYHYAFKKGKMPNRRVEDKILKASSRPYPPIRAVEVFSKYRDHIYASIDSSDGLAASLEELSKASKVALTLRSVPVAIEAFEYAEENNLKPEELALYGGEEFETILLIDSKISRELILELEAVNVKASIVGAATPGEGVWIIREDKKMRVESRGWEHFR